jgi:hypothetical protein
VNGSDQMKLQKGLISLRHVQLGRISKDYGASACWKGVPEVEELWNTVLVTSVDRGFAGCAPKAKNTFSGRGSFRTF